MLKETGYQEKIELLRPWLEQIIEVVKKDLKNEHLKIDRDFCKRYFLGKSAGLISTVEMAEAYAKDIANGNVGLGEFIATRWLLKNSDIYGFFEERLKTITPDFDHLEALPDELISPLLEGALKQFGARRTYLFSVFNSVLFPDRVYEELRRIALSETEQVQQQEEQAKIEGSLTEMQKRHERELHAIKDRDEKKLIGLQKKYLNDTEMLKNQIRQLQKKLNG